MKTAIVVVMALALCGSVFAASDVYLDALPEKAGLPPAFVLFIPGAMMDNAGYADVIRQTQAASNFRIWAALPHFSFDMPLTAAEINNAYERALKYLTGIGMPAGAMLFVGGHSMGAANVQSFVAAHPYPYKGVLLTGGALLRKNAADPNWKVPTIAVNGDLDGLLRFTRTAEAYYRQVVLQKSSATRPVIAVVGMSHAQASSGEPSVFVKANDFKPDASLADAQEAIATSFAYFMDSVAHPDFSTAAASAQKIAERVRASDAVLAPVYGALVMEGSYHLAAPCNSDTPSPHCPYYPAYPDQKDRKPSNDTACTCGSAWTAQVAQPSIAGLAGTAYAVGVVDAFHDVNDIAPFHHPHIVRCCALPEFLWN